jgi:hypothetical protein
MHDRHADARATERFARALLWMGALAFAGPGLGFLLAPERFAAAVDLALLSPTAASDVRAVFGGLEIGLALWLGATALGSAPLGPALAAQCAALGGMVVGRVASLGADGVPGALGWLLFAIETALLVASLVAIRSLARARSRHPSDGEAPGA